jgi:AraC family transcriptional regulator of adaptative response/methylated-DNA-[protein]-cysteine methyltransferase
MAALASRIETAKSAAYSTEEERWAAVARRDYDADGAFFYSVITTGIYCRPGCAARLARRENVRFHATSEDARRAGYRPCKRCRPDAPPLAQRHAKAVTQACRLMEDAETMPDLDTLADAVGMSRFHFHRIFKQITGLTPKAYGTQQRIQRLHGDLPVSTTVTAAIYGAGFNSSARFYAASSDVLGMAPSDYRAGGKGTVIRYAVGPCSLGMILVAATETGICAIQLGDDEAALMGEFRDRFPEAQLVSDDKDFEELVAKVVDFVEAPAGGLDLPLDVRGTIFQHRVWQELREITPGTTASYAEIAARIGAPKAARAVARACAANTIAIAIPCHRVIGKNGALSGYRWGVGRKRALLDREAKS